MKRKIYAISLLVSFLVVLSHQVISHHHHDTTAYDITSNMVADGHKHEHNEKNHHHQDSHQEEKSEKDTDKDHNHPFPFHNHISVTNDFDCTRANYQESNISNHSIKIITVLCLFNREYSESPELSNYGFGDPPFLIISLFEPGAIALRGPPTIV